MKISGIDTLHFVMVEAYEYSKSVIKIRFWRSKTDRWKTW